MHNVLVPVPSIDNSNMNVTQTFLSKPVTSSGNFYYDQLSLLLALACVWGSCWCLKVILCGWLAYAWIFKVWEFYTFWQAPAHGVLSQSQQKGPDYVQTGELNISSSIPARIFKPVSCWFIIPWLNWGMFFFSILSQSSRLKISMTWKLRKNCKPDLQIVVVSFCFQKYL